MEYALAYLIGSIPSGIIVSKLMQLPDPRNAGSGNIGATNMLRLSGKKAGITTLLLDILKGFLACSFFGIYGGVAALIGHIFSIFLKFKGGKGVATFIGVLLSYNPFIAAVFLASWGALFKWKKTSSLAAIAAAIVAAIVALDPIICLLSLIIVATHYQNIRRLINGTEHKFSSKV
jgi:acyl phosphate:glycerol-3-phosphate acyltransferase